MQSNQLDFRKSKIAAAKALYREVEALTRKERR